MDSDQQHLQNKVKELSEQLVKSNLAQEAMQEELKRYQLKNEALQEEIASLRKGLRELLSPPLKYPDNLEGA